MKISHYSRKEIESGLDISPNAVMISINEPGQSPADLSQYKNEKLVLHFWDVNEPIPIIGGGMAHPINEEQAAQILNVLDGREVVVHCRAGRSRSAAVAKFAEERLGYEWTTKDKPDLIPNLEVLTNLRRGQKKTLISK